MATLHDPTAAPDVPQRPRFNPFIVVAVILAVGLIAALLLSLWSSQRLKHEAATAKVVADRVIHDIKTQNGTDARNLATKQFQKKNTAVSLTERFKLANQVLKGTPTLDRSTLVNGQTDTAYFIYRYKNGGANYFIRIAVTDTGKNNAWQLLGIGGNTDENQLIVK